ncbi:FadR family transcriptional regulator (plasmid) [Agrobacterium tumefaciens]|nr:FadR family transcriptional regulator [Agrobacterium tumefaciens]
MRRRRDSLASVVAKDIAQRIDTGEYAVGARIPIETELCEIYNVSRTVVREAIAYLRSEGLVDSRQGIGAFVTGRGNVTLKIPPEAAEELSEIIDILELRIGVEVESAGLAAQRADEAELGKILECLEKTADPDAFNQNPRQLDFNFHKAIALASGNAYMPRFMDFVGPVIIPRSQLIHSTVPKITREYLAKMTDEHRRIAVAIKRKDVLGAREAMRFHLAGSLERYRELQLEK